MSHLTVNSGKSVETSTLKVENKEWKGVIEAQFDEQCFEDAIELVEFFESTLPSRTMDFLVEKLAKRRGFVRQE